MDTSLWRGHVQGMAIKYWDKKVRKRHMYRFAGVGPQLLYKGHNNSVRNLRRSLVERVFCVEDRDGNLVPTPRPRPNTIRQRLSEFSRRLSKHAFPILPLSYDQFVDRYSGRKRKVYERAVESLHERPVGEKDAVVKSFVKWEKTAKSDPAPRVIQPRDPRYNVEVGRYIAHAEKPLFRAIGKLFGGCTVFKGMNASEQGTALAAAWSEFDHPVAIGLDASRFDQHVSVDALKWEHRQWEKFVPKAERKRLRKLLSWQLHNKGIGRADDGTIKYNVEGCRMSGDMNTSSGNCLLMCAMVYAYVRGCGVVKFRLVNNGDDCVLIVEKADLHRLVGLQEWFLEMGFTMKVEPPVETLEEIEFCQTKPVWTPSGYKMVRDPRKAMAKDLTSACGINNPKVRRRWCHAMRSGGLALTAELPVWQDFYRMFPEDTHAGELKPTQELAVYWESGLARLSRGMRASDAEISDETRYSFWVAFGVLPDEQRALEVRFRNIRLDEARLEPAALRAEPVTPLGDLLPITEQRVIGM